MRPGASSLTLGVVLLLGHALEARSQPLGAKLSAAPSELAPELDQSGCPSVRHWQPEFDQSVRSSLSGVALHCTRSTVPRSPRLRVAPVQRDVEREDKRERRSARAPAAEDIPSCQAGKPKVGNWQALREHVATCWKVPASFSGALP